MGDAEPGGREHGCQEEGEDDGADRLGGAGAQLEECIVRRHGYMRRTLQSMAVNKGIIRGGNTCVHTGYLAVHDGDGGGWRCGNGGGVARGFYPCKKHHGLTTLLPSMSWAFQPL